MVAVVVPKSRGPGVHINPQRVKEARREAGLTMAELGGKDVSRTFIHYLETGASRPSKEVLAMIARKTGKPVRYFTVPGSDESLSMQVLAKDLVRLAARVRRLSGLARLDTQQRQSLRLLESSLRQGAVLTRNLKPREVATR